jgi:MiaB/RimO family radical SAM methylthiotransferase
MAERLQEELLENNMADLVVGPDAYRDLPRLIDEWKTHQEDPIIDEDYYAMNVQLSLDETYEDIVPIRGADAMSHSAFVSIQRGCSNRCSFCIVPFTRGQERSRPLESIVREIQQLVDNNEQQQHNTIKEVVLLGQNVNSYHDRSEAALAARPHATAPGLLSNAGFRNRIRRPESGGGHSFCDLVEAVAEISPELRVRFTSPHPKDYPPDLLHIMASTPNVCNQLHMPAQSGATSMLERMKRGYSRDAYLELIDNVKSIIPDVALSSDFIAGFCQETQDEHDDTVSLLKEVEYEQAFLFAYSMREKTYAHRKLVDSVPAAIKQERLQELIDTYRHHVHAKNERVEVGKLRLVLVEGPAKRQTPGTTTRTWHGRTDQNKRILFPAMEDEGAVMALEENFVSSLLLHPGQQERNTHTHTPTTQVTPGDYAVVEVTEAKGHTLRGRMLWKTTLANFDKFQTANHSGLIMDPDRLRLFKESLHDRILIDPMMVDVAMRSA